MNDLLTQLVERASQLQWFYQLVTAQIFPWTYQEYVFTRNWLKSSPYVQLILSKCALSFPTMENDGECRSNHFLSIHILITIPRGIIAYTRPIGVVESILVFGPRIRFQRETDIYIEITIE